MKPIPHAHISQLSSTDPDLDLYQWQRLADYSDSSFLNFYLYAGSDRSLGADFDTEGTSSGKKIMTILGVTATLLLLGSALWCGSVECNQSYPILEEAMEVENAPAVNSFFNY